MTTAIMEEKIRQMEDEIRQLRAELEKVLTPANGFEHVETDMYLTEVYNG